MIGAPPVEVSGIGLVLLMIEQQGGQRADFQ